MKKAFYNDPQKAAWMICKFDVNIIIPNPKGEKKFYKPSTLLTHVNWKKTKMQNTPERYYVDWESLHIFEPKSNDIIITGNGTKGAAFVDDEVLQRYARATDEQRVRVNLMVIQREGIAFMWPEFE